MKRRWTAVLACVAGIAAAAYGSASVAAQAAPHTAPYTAAKLAPRIQITLTPKLVAYDDDLTADVFVAGAKGAAGGEVDIDGVPGGDCEALDLVGGRTNCDADQLDVPIGMHAVTVHYSGSRTYRAAVKTVRVYVTRAATEMDVDMSPESPGTAGRPVTFSVDLSDAAGTTAGAGSVAFVVAGTANRTICPAVAVHTNRTVSCRTTLQAGSYTVYYRFSGSPHLAPATVSVPYTVTG